MWDKIADFILILVVTVLCIIIGIFGYVMYNEIIEKDISISNFIGDFSNDKSSTNKNTITIQTDEGLFEGVNDKEIEQGSNEIESKKYRHLYNQLDSTAKIIYDKLYENKENLKTGTYIIQFGNVFQTLLASANGENELRKQYQSAIEALIYENPELFYIDVTKMFINIEKITRLTGIQYNVYIDCGNTTGYLAENFSSKQDIENHEKQIEEAKNNILNMLVGKNDFEKIKTVHDYLIDTIEYDSTISQDNIYNIYGALVSKVCVCEGYAKSFQYIMNEIGIDNTIVIGKGTNSSGNTENHAWNYVELDGKWYAVDVTWDDPILIGGGKLPEKSRYQYFLKGSKTMEQNHFASGKFTDIGQVFVYPELSVEDYQKN